MENRIRFEISGDALYVIRVEDVAMHEMKFSFVSQPLQIALGAIALQVIEHAQVDALGQCICRQIAAEKTAAAGDQ